MPNGDKNMKRTPRFTISTALKIKSQTTCS